MTAVIGADLLHADSRTAEPDFDIGDRLSHFIRDNARDRAVGGSELQINDLLPGIGVFWWQNVVVGRAAMKGHRCDGVMGIGEKHAEMHRPIGIRRMWLAAQPGSAVPGCQVHACAGNGISMIILHANQQGINCMIGQGNNDLVIVARLGDWRLGRQFAESPAELAVFRQSTNSEPAIGPSLNASVLRGWFVVWVGNDRAGNRLALGIEHDTRYYG